jgi:antitoxin (DNA-binding transcriptional repressor) of toxin-antitoxin stability system
VDPIRFYSLEEKCFGSRLDRNFGPARPCRGRWQESGFIREGTSLLDININIIFMFRVKTISMVDLRTQSERIVRDLKRGERMMLSYRGEPLAELVPSGIAAKSISPLEALKRVQDLTARDAGMADRAQRYLQDLREDQKTWSKRSSS